jgi:hypothetical protein
MGPHSEATAPGGGQSGRQVARASLTGSLSEHGGRSNQKGELLRFEVEKLLSAL